jgi:hypothetical protein
MPGSVFFGTRFQNPKERRSRRYYLVSLGLDGIVVNDLMTLLENRRFDVTA